ncbi:MAG: galactose-1-phosphate uridylyltransferase [Candidatus Dormibacterales bacterium]
MAQPDGGRTRAGRSPPGLSAGRPPGELRWHPLLGEWVTVAPWRQERSFLPPASECPLCPTRPGGTPTEVPGPDYEIAVFENRFPAYAGETGRCEVVCYTDDHDSSLAEQTVEHIVHLIEVWQARFQDLMSLPQVRYVFIFENRGEEMGVTLHHPHGQIYAYPFLPPLAAREIEMSARHRRRTGGCLYCQVMEEESGGPGRVAGDAHWAAFVPSFARWPYEVHLAPRRHLGDITELEGPEVLSMAEVLKRLLTAYDRLFGRPLPYVMAMHQRPKGRGRRDCHLHVEFYPPHRTATKLKFLAGSELGAGAFLVDARSEETAARLRETAAGA